MGGENEKKKDDIVTAGMKYAKKFHISSNPKAMFWYGLFQSGIFLVYAIFHYVVYFDMLLLMAILYIILAYTDLEAKRKERKENVNTQTK